MSGEPIRDDQILVQYLLGSLPEDQSERLDELSVSDDDFVWRLHAAENDLVDAYVRNELSGETLERFRSFYLSSTLRREKVKFAETLLALGEHEPPSTRWWFTAPMAIPRWGLAAAIAAALLIAGVLIYDNTRLRNRVQEAKQEHRQQVPSRTEESAPAPVSVAMVLTPPVRGAGKIPELAAPRAAGSALFEVQLETGDFPAYQIELKKPSTDRALWRSDSLKAHPAGSRRAVSIAVPTNLLESGTYILELSSVGPNPEVIANYAFKVVPK